MNTLITQVWAFGFAVTAIVLTRVYDYLWHWRPLLYICIILLAASAIVTVRTAYRLVTDQYRK